MYLTIKGREDGFGAQYHAMLSGIAYCYHYNHFYIHTPFTKIEHCIDITKANLFIGIPLTNTSKIDIAKTFIEEVHYSRSPSLYYSEEVLGFIRSCYYSTPKPEIDPIDIAIHIRRGDVTKEKNSERYKENVAYRNILKKICLLYPGKITVFSEGSYEDFIDLGLEKECFRLNTDMFEIFHSLVSAKVLVMGFSSFSYCAGLLNPHTVYHEDTFWHHKLDHWKRISKLYE